VINMENDIKDSKQELPTWFKSALLAVGIAAVIIGIIIYIVG